MTSAPPAIAREDRAQDRQPRELADERRSIIGRAGTAACADQPAEPDTEQADVADGPDDPECLGPLRRHGAAHRLVLELRERVDPVTVGRQHQIGDAQPVRVGVARQTLGNLRIRAVLRSVQEHRDVGNGDDPPDERDEYERREQGLPSVIAQHSRSPRRSRAGARRRTRSTDRFPRRAPSPPRQGGSFDRTTSRESERLFEGAAPWCSSASGG